MHTRFRANRPCVSRSRRGSKTEAGSGIIEAALSLTVFLMLLLGAMDFGRMIWAFNTLSFATKAGARYAIVRGDDSGSPASSTDVTNAVKAQAIGLTASDLIVTTTWTPDKKAGSVVKVQTSYDFAPLMPFMPTGPISLVSSSQMVISR